MSDLQELTNNSCRMLRLERNMKLFSRRETSRCLWFVRERKQDLHRRSYPRKPESAKQISAKSVVLIYFRLLC